MLANEDIQATINDEVRNKPWRFTILGVASMFLGGVGLLYAGAVTITSLFAFGAVLFASGFVHLYQAARYRDANGVIHNLPIGILDIVVGALVLARPLASLLALTLVIGAFFIVSGAFRIVAAVALRMENWGLPLLSGLFSILLGLIVAFEWPLSSFWLIGTYVCAYLVVSGATFFALGVLANRAPGLARPGFSG